MTGCLACDVCVIVFVGIVGDGHNKWRGCFSKKAGLKCIRAFLFSIVFNAIFLDSLSGFLRLLVNWHV